MSSFNISVGVLVIDILCPNYIRNHSACTDLRSYILVG